MAAESARYRNTAAPEADINLSDGSRLPAWEDQVAQGLAGDARLEDMESWEGRPPLQDLLRLPGFNGALRDIQIVPFDDPKQELLDAVARKATFAHGDYTRPHGKLSEIPANNFKGYLLVATATSSAQSAAGSQGRVGDIYAAVWYELKFPSAKNNRPFDVWRYMLEPLTDRAAFELLLARSQHIGRTVTGHAIAHPLPGGTMSTSQRKSRHAFPPKI